MISALSWVPRGAADPRPKKYELSPAELNMLKIQAREEAGLEEEAAVEGESSSDDDEEAAPEPKVVLPKVDISSLPADLRMDDYSSDEGEAEDVGSMIVGHGSELVGTSINEDGVPSEGGIDESSEEEEEEEEKGPEGDGGDLDSDSDSDDSEISMDEFDPLQNDDREYEPINVAG